MYEIICKTHNEKEKNLLKKMKDIAFKSKEDYSSKNSYNDDKDIKLLIKWFKKFMMKNKTNIVRREGKNKIEPKKNTIIYYKFKKLGHYKNECPWLKKKLLI